MYTHNLCFEQKYHFFLMKFSIFTAENILHGPSFRNVEYWLTIPKCVERETNMALDVYCENAQNASIIQGISIKCKIVKVFHFLFSDLFSAIH